MRFGCRSLVAGLTCVFLVSSVAAAQPTWSPPQLLASAQSGFSARPAFDGQGGAYVLTGDTAAYRVYFAASPGDAWQALPPLSASFLQTQGATLVADAAGRLTVVYRYSPSSATDELRAERYTPGVGWGAPRTLYATSAPVYVGAPSVVVDALSNVVVCMQNGDIAVTVSDTLCTVYDAATDAWSTPRPVAHNLLAAPALVRSPNGMSVVLTGIPFDRLPRRLQVWRYDVASRSWSGASESVPGSLLLSNFTGNHDFVAGVDDTGGIDLVALRPIAHLKSSFAGLRGEGGRWRQTPLLDWSRPPYQYGSLIDPVGAVDAEGRIIVARQVGVASGETDGDVFIGGPGNVWRVDKLYTEGPPDSGVFGVTSATWAGSSGEAVVAFPRVSTGLTPYFFDGQSWAAVPLPQSSDSIPVLGTSSTGNVLLVYLTFGGELYATWLQRQ